MWTKTAAPTWPAVVICVLPLFYSNETGLSLCYVYVNLMRLQILQDFCTDNWAWEWKKHSRNTSPSAMQDRNWYHYVTIACCLFIKIENWLEILQRLCQFNKILWCVDLKMANRTYKSWYVKGIGVSIVSLATQKMALRAFYCIKRSQRHLLAPIESN